MVYTDPAERRKRACVLVHKIASDIREAWDKRATRGDGVTDPVILLLYGGGGDCDDDDPAEALVLVQSAAKTADEISLFAPGLAAHLLHLDTRECRVVVSMKLDVFLLGTGEPCQACRRPALPS